MARNKTVASKTKPQIDILPCKVPLRTMTARQPEGKPPPDSFEFRSKMAALYTAARKQNITLHDAYNMPKCPEELNCSECGNFYTHLNSLGLHTVCSTPGWKMMKRLTKDERGSGTTTRGNGQGRGRRGGTVQYILS